MVQVEALLEDDEVSEQWSQEHSREKMRSTLHIEFGVSKSYPK